MKSEDIPDDLQQMRHKIRALQAENVSRIEKKPDKIASKGIGIRLAADLLAGVLVGAGIGYVLDWVFGSRPIMLAIFLLFGGAAGFLNVYRSAHNIDGDAGQERGH